MNSDCLFFVHIPKTAGTSFRKAVEEFYGFDSVCYDYNQDSVETSSIVKEEVYRNKDIYGFFEKFAASSYRFLSGHVSAGKYTPLFGSNKTVTFLRDPLQRVRSEYEHFVRHNKYDGDFASFYRKPQFINRMSKIIGAVPLESIGVVGLTEKYSESLDLINNRYEIGIPNLELNVGRERKNTPYHFDNEEYNELKSLNKEDINLYESAVKLFGQRLEMRQKGVRYAHGAMQQVSVKSTRGWCWWERSELPVEIDVYADNQKVGSCLAGDLRPGLLRLGIPRKGYVGFHFAFTKDLPIGTSIRCEVHETGQVLGESQVQAVSK